MAGRISGDLEQNRGGLSPVHQTNEVRPAGDTDGVDETKQDVKQRPVPSGALTAKRRLDSGGVRTVLEGVASQVELALRELEKPTPEPSRVAPALRSALKQLGALTTIEDDVRPQLTLLAGLTHQLLEAAMGNKAAAKHFQDVPLNLANKVAEHLSRMVLDEVGTASPIGAKAVGDLISLTGDRENILRELARMYPGAEAFGGIDKLVEKLDRDLGELKAEITASMRDRKISQTNIDAFFRAFAEVRQGFEIGAAKGDDFQRTNWVHTRIEVLHSLQAAIEQGLSPELSLATALGALSSDSFKDSSTFSLLWHNRGGAELVLPLIVSRHFPQNNKTLLEDSRRVALEHQITPAVFMSMAMRFFVGATSPGIEEIVAKVDNPNAAPQKNGEVIFSKEALASLHAKGLPGWSVLQPGSRHHLASLAAIVGDVLQYPGLDGVIKYAFDIRDPEESRPFMRDKLISDAVNSSLINSFAQGMKVIEDVNLLKMATAFQSRMKTLIEKTIYPEVDRRLREALKSGPDDPIPYWTSPVEAPLKEGERAIVDLVKLTLAQVASEKGNVPLDPFGHVAKRAAE